MNRQQRSVSRSDLNTVAVWSRRATALHGFLILVSKNLADAAVDAGGILSCGLNHVVPFLPIGIQAALREEVGSLHDRFDRVAEIVSQSP